MHASTIRSICPHASSVSWARPAAIISASARTTVVVTPAPVSVRPASRPATSAHKPFTGSGMTPCACIRLISVSASARVYVCVVMG